jgi:hypothetical protein
MIEEQVLTLLTVHKIAEPHLILSKLSDDSLEVFEIFEPAEDQINCLNQRSFGPAI